MSKIEEIYEIDGGYEALTQYADESWVCQLDDEEDVKLSLVAMSTDMEEATGEDEYKDYPIVPELGIINRHCHVSISKNMAGDEFEGEYSDLGDVNGYCGLVYFLDLFLSTDEINKNLMGELKIEDACLKSYQCRFTGEQKQYPAFKTHEACQDFLKALIEAYAPMHMTMIGFLLDRPVNLAGETGWRTIKLCKEGI